VAIGEPDPQNGGQLEAKGSVWHTWVAPASGYIAAHITRTTTDKSQWYRIGVWEGTDQSNLKHVRAFNAVQTYNAQPAIRYYEVRAGMTYKFQVIRDSWQTWGEYTLNIAEYLEYNEWDHVIDGFTSMTTTPGYPSFGTGGVMTMTGAQVDGGGVGIPDLLNVLPQYGTVDLGTDTPKWGREVRIHFDLRVVGGQVLARQLWWGGDDWNFTNAASNDHVNLTMNRLGLLRMRDINGAQVMLLSLAPGSKGENLFELYGGGVSGSGGNKITVPWSSVGAAGPQNDTGWVSVELVIIAGTHFDSGDPTWTPELYIDGRPVGPNVNSSNQASSWAYYIGKQIRYVDFGMYRHPSMILANDQHYAENNEAWTYQMRRMRVTNKVPHEAYDMEYAGDAGVFQFDGFASQVGWTDTFWNYSSGPTYGSYRAKYSKSAFDSVSTVGAAPGGKSGGTFRTSSYAQHSRVTYSMQRGSRRVYGFSLYAAQLPASKVGIAGFTQYSSSGVPTATAGGMGALTLDGTGELRIRPYNLGDFCVAHLQEATWYWIEVHVDAEVMWDVRCSVYINGTFFGTFSNVDTWSDVFNGEYVQGAPFPGQHDIEQYLAWGSNWAYQFNSSAVANPVPHDLHFTTLVAARGAPGAAIGPMQTKAIPAATAVTGHHIPDEPVNPADYMDLLDAQGDVQWKLHSWMHEWITGPYTVVIPDGKTEGKGNNTGLPRFWEAYFVLQGTHPLLISGNGPYQFTMTGQSVPVDAVVTGIQVTAPAGTARLIKNGVAVGNSYTEAGSYGGPEDMWGTSWTPIEINSLNFGVQLDVPSTLEGVRVKVYFADQGSPGNIGRGGTNVYLPPTGLFNLYGDSITVEMFVTGNASTAGFGWWTNGEFSLNQSGGQPNPPSGTPSQRWTSCYPLWLWQARSGNKWVEIKCGGVAGNSITTPGLRYVRNPLVYPRFAWSANDGASYTWIYPGEDESENHIGGDVGSVVETNVLFTDNTAVFDRYLCHDGSWASGLNQDRPTASPAYRYMYWHIKFNGGSSGDSEIFAANFWARFRGNSGHPTTSKTGTAQFRAHIRASNNNEKRQIGTFTGISGQTVTSRLTRPRSAHGEPWTTGDFNDMELSVGYFNANVSATEVLYSDQSKGAAIYAMTWEILVPAAVEPPPSPCLQLIDLSMARTVSGTGDAVGGTLPGVDLSDAKFASGVGDEISTNTGIDLSDTLFASGAAPPEE
jgi:hypothetical protein